MKNIPLLTLRQIGAAMKRLDGWKLVRGRKIRKLHEFGSFSAALRFVNRVGWLAEQADHHPDIDIRYRRVTLALSTHSAGGLTRKDFALAGRIERIA